MAYQNGSWPGYAQGYGPAQPATRNHPAYPGHPAPPPTQSHPAYPGHPGGAPWPADGTWPAHGSWPAEPPGDGPGYYGPPGPPPPPPGPPSPRHAPVGVHIVAVMQYVTGLVLLLGAVAIGVVTFNDGRVGDTELPASVRGAVTGYGLAIAALALVCGLIALSIGRRLHRGRRGARILVLVLSAASLAANVYSLVTTGVADPLSGLVLPTLYLVLLNTGPARAWFRRY